MKKPMPFEKMSKEKKSDKGMKEGSKADMAKDKMMKMKMKMASGGKAMGMTPQVLPASGKPMGGTKAPMPTKPVGKPMYTGGGKPMGGISPGIKKGYRRGGMCK